MQNVPAAECYLSRVRGTFCSLHIPDVDNTSIGSGKYFSMVAAQDDCRDFGLHILIIMIVEHLYSIVYILLFPTHTRRYTISHCYVNLPPRRSYQKLHLRCGSNSPEPLPRGIILNGPYFTYFDGFPTHLNQFYIKKIIILEWAQSSFYGYYLRNVQFKGQQAFS